MKCGAYKGQLGLEPTPELYCEHLMMIFREVKRVLKKSGSFWLNISDTYWGGKGQSGQQTPEYQLARFEGGKSINRIQIGGPGITMPKDGKHPILKPKCMVCIPERVMFAMIENGWLLRNKCIWRKPNSMPSSVKDRLSTSWEYLYFFVKNNTTCLWRNRETGEWRDTRPTKEENYPYGMRDEQDNKLQPLWMGFDYYFELDAIRQPHKTQSLERYQRQVNFGDRTPQSKYLDTNPYPEGTQPIYREGRNLCPDWFKEMFPEDKDYKGKFDDMFGHGPNPQSFNIRVRDVKRGKGGATAQGGELTASEKEIEEYDYPEKTKRDKQYRRWDTEHQITPTDAPNRSSVDWRAEAAKKGQLFDSPVVHQGGGNTGLGKHHGSSHDGRAGFDREARGRPLIAPHHRYRGDGWEKQAIEGREPKTKHDIAVGRTGNVSYTDPLHKRAYYTGHKYSDDSRQETRQGFDNINAKGHSGYFDKDGNPLVDFAKGKNPGDILDGRGYHGKSHRFGRKSHGGEKENLIAPEEGTELHAFHPLGKNPGDILEVTTQPSSISVCPQCETVFKRTVKVCPNCGHKGVTGHFAPYPEALPEMPIRACSRPGDVVLDPFAGGGTTGVVAKKLGRKSILIDVVKEYVIMARHRIQKVEYQPEMELK